jgi:hypothetical protein
LAIDVTTFLSVYPEFLDAPTALVQAKLTEAQQMVPDSVWGSQPGGSVAGTSGASGSNFFAWQNGSTALGGGGSLTQQATFLYCAKFLALSPYARKMALVAKDGSTIYDVRLKQLLRIVTSGNRVT